MNNKRALRLRREVLTELRHGELESVAGAAGETFSLLPTWCFFPFSWCFTCLTCLCGEDGGAPAGR